MKKLLFVLGIGVLGSATFPKSSEAQVSINVNIGAQPLWGPVGYDHVDYYYLPDIESYYYVPTRQFVYLSNGRWIFGASLPSRFRNYDLYRGYKVVINQPRPYVYFKDHRVKYSKYRGYHGHQQMIRYSNDSRYYVVKGHPKHLSNGKGYKSSPNRGYGGGYKGNGKGKNKN
jgi:hypothetical protein